MCYATKKVYRPSVDQKCLKCDLYLQDLEQKEEDEYYEESRKHETPDDYPIEGELPDWLMLK